MAKSASPAPDIVGLLKWPMRFLAAFEVIDAFIFMADAQWSADNAVLVGLTLLGIVGFALTCLSARLPIPEWLALGLGALFVAVAPAILYPLSGVLFLAGLVVLGVGPVAASRVGSARVPTA